jgi:hypothetical protein
MRLVSSHEEWGGGLKTHRRRVLKRISPLEVFVK